jgi:DNA-binding FadR family transcriptional regulator
MSIPSPTIKRRKLADDVQVRLLELIRGSEYIPGDQLPSERELMRTYEVGRPAIREAMQNLQRMGLIDIKHGERPRVAEPSFSRTVEQMGETMRHLLKHSPANLGNLKEARVVFDMEMARIAARKHSVENITKLKKIIDNQEAANPGSKEFLICDGQFHREIAAISGNPIFASLSEALFSWMTHFHVDLVRMPGFEKLTIEEHRGVLAAIEQRDSQAAARKMSDHLTRANALYNREHDRSKKEIK